LRSIPNKLGGILLLLGAILILFLLPYVVYNKIKGNVFRSLNKSGFVSLFIVVLFLG